MAQQQAQLDQQQAQLDQMNQMQSQPNPDEVVDKDMLLDMLIKKGVPEQDAIELINQNV